MPTKVLSFNDIKTYLLCSNVSIQFNATMCFGSHSRTKATMNTGTVQNFSTFHIHLPSAFTSAFVIIAALFLLLVVYCIYRQLLIRRQRRRQQAARTTVVRYTAANNQGSLAPSVQEQPSYPEPSAPPRSTMKYDQM